MSYQNFKSIERIQSQKFPHATQDFFVYWSVWNTENIIFIQFYHLLIQFQIN